MIIICHAQFQTGQYKKQSSSTLVSHIPYGGLWCSSRDVPAPDKKSFGWCCCNPRPTVIDPDYNMIKQRCIKRIYDKIRSKSPPNRATSPSCLHCDVTHPSLTTGVVASRWGIILRSTVRTSDISWFSLPLLLKKKAELRLDASDMVSVGPAYSVFSAFFKSMMVLKFPQNNLLCANDQ